MAINEEMLDDFPIGVVRKKTFNDLPRLFDGIIECINEKRKKTISATDLQLMLDYIKSLEDRVAELTKIVESEQE